MNYSILAVSCALDSSDLILLSYHVILLASHAHNHHTDISLLNSLLNIPTPSLLDI